jgi:orotidine-5'-phosphate decarboxylase
MIDSSDLRRCLNSALAVAYLTVKAVLALDSASAALSLGEKHVEVLCVSAYSEE